MKSNPTPKPFIDFSKKYTVCSTLREEFSLTPSPMSVTGGDYRYQHVQGGCEAKGYLYTCMHTPYTTPNKCCIIKQDFRTGEVVGHSREFEFGHANDATFNPDENTIVVSFCDHTNQNAILDADTLSLKEIKVLEGDCLCNIDYDPERQIYVCVDYQCRFIYVYDKEFRLIKSFEGFMSQGVLREFVMQGVVTDGIYAYVLEWHGGERWARENITESKDVKTHFLVFDLKTGKYVDTVDLGIRREIEYAVYRNGRFYVGCNNIRWNGLELYEVEITAQ